jgi:putative heme-binding domain-containing protein
LREKLRDARAGVRRAALLALLDLGALEDAAVRSLVSDPDSATAGVAALWVAQRDGNPLIVIEPPPGDFVDRVRVKITPGMKPASVAYTTDGSEPKFVRGAPKPNLNFEQTTTLKAALFVNGQKVGNTATGVYRKLEAEPPPSPVKLTATSEPVTLAQVMNALPKADLSRGRTIFHAAGCVGCHRKGAEGGAFAPDLSNLGARGNVDRIVRAILEPSAEITEGFALRSFALKDGRSLAGRLLEEGQTNVTIIQPDNQTVNVRRDEITSEQSMPVSAMPPFDRAMSVADHAALVAWLTQTSVP